jgi:hypothetical protein
MNVGRGTYTHGRIELDTSVDWPEGCSVLVEPVMPAEKIGIDESEWPDTPEKLADWLAWFDSFEPVELTPDDEAEIAAARAAVRDATLAAVQRRMESLE